MILSTIFSSYFPQNNYLITGILQCTPWHLLKLYIRKYPTLKPSKPFTAELLMTTCKVFQPCDETQCDYRLKIFLMINFNIQPLSKHLEISCRWIIITCAISWGSGRPKFSPFCRPVTKAIGSLSTSSRTSWRRSTSCEWTHNNLLEYVSQAKWKPKYLGSFHFHQHINSRMPVSQHHPSSKT